MSSELVFPVGRAPSDSPNEECGVIGVFTPEGEASRLAFFGLFALQHRGQESAGIAAANGENVVVHTDMGLVSKVMLRLVCATLAATLVAMSRRELSRRCR